MYKKVNVIYFRKEWFPRRIKSVNWISSEILCP